MNAVYDGYSQFEIWHSFDKIYTFRHRYNYEPTLLNFSIPAMLSLLIIKFKIIFERNLLAKVFQVKPNFGYPYLIKNKYFRPLNENRYLKKNLLTKANVFPHEYVKPQLSCDHHHDSHHKEDHPKVAHSH